MHLSKIFTKHLVYLLRTGSCEDGWYLHDIYCFRFVFNNTENWANARSACTQFYGNAVGTSSMAAILSEDEFLFLRDTWQAAGFRDDFSQWYSINLIAQDEIFLYALVHSS